MYALSAQRCLTNGFCDKSEGFVTGEEKYFVHKGKGRRDSAVNEHVAVPAHRLRRHWDPVKLGFATTAELQELEGLVGQERAVSALAFGLSIRSPGYNMFVAGPAGTGKTSYSGKLVTEQAQKAATPNDWVYVYHFDHPDEPMALSLPAGTAPEFAAQVEETTAHARRAASRALSTREYHGQRDALVQTTRAMVGQWMEEVEEQARQAGFALVAQAERGLMPVPLLQGQPMTEEKFDQLAPEARREFKEKAQRLQAAVAELGRRSAEAENHLHVQLRAHDMKAARAAMAPLLGQLQERYRHLPRVAAWLGRAEQELVGFSVPGAFAEDRAAEEAAAADMQVVLATGRRRTDPFARFRVNVFVHRQAGAGAPVVVEPNPTYANLFGKAEVPTGVGGPADDGVMQIKPGALHRANGGYLILQAADVLRSPFAWEALKRALNTREARIEVPGQENRLLPIDSVRPEPIPIDVKVVLIGSSALYHGLYSMDDGFRKQFKLKAEFDVSMEANETNVRGYAGFVSSICRREQLRHFTAGGVAEVIEHSHRLADDQAKLSARFNEVVEVIYEANAWAAQDGADTVGPAHVKKAIQEKGQRSALPAVSLQELIRRGTILVDVDGAVVGQVNGLTVMNVGDYSFGSPSRITARAYMGQQGIVHIEREIAMSGQIHDKGVLTLSAFLGDRFAQNRPLALSASIAFEQTYVPVDGDSASSTELYALLSALAGLPVDQGIAVTGSVNQRGQIQPIGGVNEKIEGFFHVCKLSGLTGRQGVMIPTQNVPNLMLSDEVVEAVLAGQFHIWAVATIEEGIEVLTGIPAGERQANGAYTPGSAFDRVDSRLETMARQLQAWKRGERGE
jgi:lon-related putative ATP-dependent protease